MAAENNRPCYDRGNGSPFCAPIPSDIWEEGTMNEFVWNYNYPYYVASENISLYLYYKDKYAYQPIKNWTTIHRAAGSLAVQVDNSWFPSRNSTTAVLYGYYLPQGMDPAAELANPESQFPRPFNFSVERPSAVDENGHPLSHDGSDIGGGNNVLPGWAVALIVILCLGLVGVAFGFFWLIFRRRHHPRRRCINNSSNTKSSAFTASSASVMTTGSPSLAPPSYPAGDTGSSIYSTTPIMHQVSPRVSDVRLPTTEEPCPRPPGTQQHPPRLAESTYMWMVDQQEQAHSDEDHRRRLGEALLAQQLSQEEGASVKHAERRPITVSTENTMIRSEESVAVLEELAG